MNVLINAKADVNYRGKDGYTALMEAAKRGYEDLVYFLIKAGADVNAKTRLKVGETPAQTTPLMQAATFGQDNVIRVLLNATARTEINAKNSEGKTALHLAIGNNKKSAVIALLKAGANLHIKDNDNVSPLDLMKKMMTQAEIKSILGAIKSPMIVKERKKNKESKKAGDDIFKCFNGVYLALCAAIEDNDVEALKALHEAGLNLNTVGLGLPSLLYAHLYGPADAVKSLLQAGANINQVDSRGESLYDTFVHERERVSFKQKIKDLEDDPRLGEQARQWTAELAVRDKMRAYVRRVGHGIGLSQRINISSPKIVQINGITILEPHVVSVRTEGTTKGTHFGAKYVHEKLNRFLQNKIRRNKFIIAPWQKIYEAFEHLVKSEADQSRPLSKALFQRYQSKQLIIIPTGWSGHRVCVSIYGDKLVITNRGDKGDQKFGAKIYQIPKKHASKITENFIDSLINNVNANPFFETISTIVNLEQPLYLFPLKGQKRGTCDVANHKSSIEPLLAVLEHDLRGIPMEQAINRAQHDYKEFTHFIREDEIDILIKNVQNKQNKKVDNDFYLEMVKAVLKEHHSLPDLAYQPQQQPYKKVKNMEMDRAQRLIGALPTHYLNALKLDPEMQAILQKCKEYELNVKEKTFLGPLKPKLTISTKPLNKKPIPVDEPLLVMQRNALRTIISRLEVYIKELDAHPHQKGKGGIMFSTKHQAKKQIATELMDEFLPLIQEDKKDDVRKLFKGEETSEGLTLEDVQQFVKKEIELDKKSSSVFAKEKKLKVILKDINTLLLHKPESKMK